MEMEFELYTFMYNYDMFQIISGNMNIFLGRYLKRRGRYRPCENYDFTRSNCLIYIKSGNMVKKSGEKENYQQNREKLELSHSQH